MKTRLWLAFALLGLAPLAASAEEFYREMDLPLNAYVPHVEGDMQLSRTYPLWKDRSKLDWRLAGDPEENWQLNWKFMDPPFNSVIHGGHFGLDRGDELFKQLNRKGSFAQCLGVRKGNLKGLRTHYPMYRQDLGRVAGLEEVIEHCAGKEGLVLENGSYDNSAVSLYVASKSNGMNIDIDVSKGPLKEAYERGRKLFHSKTGDMSFACSSCHTHNVGQLVRGSHISSPYGDAAHYPVYHSKHILESMHLRFIECNLDTRTQPLRPGSQAYTDIEVFLTALTNGYPVAVPSERY